MGEKRTVSGQSLFTDNCVIEKRQVHRPTNLAVSSRSGLSRLSSTIGVDNIELPGIVGRQRRAAVKALGHAAERASSWLWLKRPEEL